MSLNWNDDFEVLSKLKGLGDDPDAAWATWKQQFALKPRAERVIFIRQMNDYLDTPTASREIADVWGKQRELIQLDERLSKINK